MAIRREKKSESLPLRERCGGAYGCRDQLDECPARPKEYIEHVPPNLTEKFLFKEKEIL